LRSSFPFLFYLFVFLSFYLLSFLFIFLKKCVFFFRRRSRLCRLSLCPARRPPPPLLIVAGWMSRIARVYSVGRIPRTTTVSPVQKNTRRLPCLPSLGGAKDAENDLGELYPGRLHGRMAGGIGRNGRQMKCRRLF